MDGQTRVKTLPFRRTTYAGGNEEVSLVMVAHPRQLRPPLNSDPWIQKFAWRRHPRPQNNVAYSVSDEWLPFSMTQLKAMYWKSYCYCNVSIDQLNTEHFFYTKYWDLCSAVPEAKPILEHKISIEDLAGTISTTPQFLKVKWNKNHWREPFQIKAKYRMSVQQGFFPRQSEHRS